MPELSNISSDDRELEELIAEANRRRGREERIFFVHQFLKTFDPRPEAYPHDIDFDLYDFQEELIEEIYKAITVGYDLFIEKSRDMGVSWVVLAVLFWCWLFEPGFQALIGSRKESYVDNREIDSLFGKLDFFVRTIKDDLTLPEGFREDIHRRSMKLINPENQNAIIGESSNPNFSRAGRYKVVFFDEFGFWPDAKSSWAAAGDATRCRIAVTTPPDTPSYAKVIRFSSKVKVLTLHWSKHPHKTQAWYNAEKKRRTEDEVLHELDISWEYSAAGRPYPEVDNVPFGDYPYNPQLPLYVSIDLGLDAVSLGWYQPVQNSDWMTLVAAFEESDKIIDWFFPFFGLPIDPQGNHVYSDDALKFIEMVRYWKKPIAFGDPSGWDRHIESRESAYNKLVEKGIYVQVNTLENDWISRRDATKRLLPKLRVNDMPGTRFWHECLKLSRFPTRKEESQATTPIVKPVHDWTSHHRTQTEFFSVNYKNFPIFHEESRNNRRATNPVYDDSGRLIT